MNACVSARESCRGSRRPGSVLESLVQFTSKRALNWFPGGPWAGTSELGVNPSSTFAGPVTTGTWLHLSLSFSSGKMGCQDLPGALWESEANASVQGQARAGGITAQCPLLSRHFPPQVTCYSVSTSSSPWLCSPSSLLPHAAPAHPTPAGAQPWVQNPRGQACGESDGSPRAALL